jgi:hypothetical protein
MTRAAHNLMRERTPNVDGLETLIERHPFLADLSRDHRNLFHDCASIRCFASQQIIFHEGGAADHFYIIVSSKINLETFVSGHGMVTVQELGACDAVDLS